MERKLKIDNIDKSVINCKYKVCKIHKIFVNIPPCNDKNINHKKSLNLGNITIDLSYYYRCSIIKY